MTRKQSGVISSQTTANRREILAALDRETLESRTRGQRRKLFLDHLIERVQGRTLNEQDMEQEKVQIANGLLTHVRKPDIKAEISA